MRLKFYLQLRTCPIVGLGQPVRQQPLVDVDRRSLRRGNRDRSQPPSVFFSLGREHGQRSEAQQPLEFFLGRQTLLLVGPDDLWGVEPSQPDVEDHLDAEAKINGKKHGIAIHDSYQLGLVGVVHGGMVHAERA